MSHPLDNNAFAPLSGVNLTDPELARRWRTTVRTIQRRRASGLAPPSIKIGSRRLTPIEGVNAMERAALLDGEGER